MIRVSLMLCIVYYIFSCWTAIGSGFSWPQMTLDRALLFGSGLTGFEISGVLLLSLTPKRNNALVFLLGVNGVISAFSWILLGYTTFVLPFFLIGIVQGFHFIWTSRPRKDGQIPGHNRVL